MIYLKHLSCDSSTLFQSPVYSASALTTASFQGVQFIQYRLLNGAIALLPCHLAYCPEPFFLARSPHPHDHSAPVSEASASGEPAPPLHVERDRTPSNESGSEGSGSEPPSSRPKNKRPDKTHPLTEHELYVRDTRLHELEQTIATLTPQERRATLDLRRRLRNRIERAKSRDRHRSSLSDNTPSAAPAPALGSPSATLPTQGSAANLPHSFSPSSSPTSSMEAPSIVSPGATPPLHPKAQSSFSPLATFLERRPSADQREAEQAARKADANAEGPKPKRTPHP